MENSKRIVSDPDIMLGKPIIKGTRITVELVLRKLAEGLEVEDLLKDYPHLIREDILACLEYSANVIAGEEILVS